MVWERRDELTGEDLPPTTLEWPWPAASARAIDAFGANVPTRVHDGKVHLPVSLTPVFVESA